MAVELARQEWAEGYRRLEAERENRARYRALLAQVDAITDELRRADRLASSRSPSWPPSTAAPTLGARGARRAAARRRTAAAGVSLATDAAFHLYARGARDYEP